MWNCWILLFLIAGPSVSKPDVVSLSRAKGKAPVGERCEKRFVFRVLLHQTCGDLLIGTRSEPTGEPPNQNLHMSQMIVTNQESQDKHLWDIKEVDLGKTFNLSLNHITKLISWELIRKEI